MRMDTSEVILFSSLSSPSAFTERCHQLAHLCLWCPFLHTCLEMHFLSQEHTTVIFFLLRMINDYKSINYELLVRTKCVLEHFKQLEKGFVKFQCPVVLSCVGRVVFLSLDLFVCKAEQVFHILFWHASGALLCCFRGTLHSHESLMQDTCSYKIRTIKSDLYLLGHWWFFFLTISIRTRTVEELDQRYILTPEKVKDAYLVHLIQTFTDEHNDWSIIIFTNTCK